MWILGRLKTLGCPIPDWFCVLKQQIISICEGNIAFWGPIMTKDESFSSETPAGPSQEISAIKHPPYDEAALLKYPGLDLAWLQYCQTM